MAREKKPVHKVQMQKERETLSTSFWKNTISSRQRISRTP